MRLKYDLNVGALYIRLTDARVARTREIDDNTFVDLDADGDVIGIEVISVAHPWALDTVLRNYPIPSAEAAQMRAYFRAPDAPLRTSPDLSIHRTAPALVGA